MNAKNNQPKPDFDYNHCWRGLCDNCGFHGEAFKKGDWWLCGACANTMADEVEVEVEAATEAVEAQEAREHTEDCDCPQDQNSMKDLCKSCVEQYHRWAESEEQAHWEMIARLEEQEAA